MRRRKLFCQVSPLAYQISRRKCQMARRVKDLLSGQRLAKTKQPERLPVVVYAHKSLIRRTLGTVDAQLQRNKAVNLSIAAPKVSTVVIRAELIKKYPQTIENTNFISSHPEQGQV